MAAPLLAAAIPALIDVFGDLMQSAFPDSAVREQKRLEYQLKIQETLNQIDLGQMEVNKTEAAHGSIFVAGWRPFIGWVCGVAFAYHFILQPFLAFIFAVAGKTIAMPVFDMDALFTVLMGMLGLGAMRTAEKVKGVTVGLSGALPWAGKK